MDKESRRSIQLMSQFLTTEHFTLQGARSATIAEANGRLGHYISIVGSGVVALAFVANVSSLGDPFFAFSLIILPVMVVLGIGTLIRTLQISIDYARLSQAINRIRHYYAKITPEVAPYLSLPRFDDPEAVTESMMPFHFPLQGFASTPGPVILINSVLVGAFGGILTARFVSANLGVAIVVASIGLVLALIFHTLYTRRLWEKWARQSLEVRFPSPQD